MRSIPQNGQINSSEQSSQIAFTGSSVMVILVREVLCRRLLLATGVDISVRLGMGWETSSTRYTLGHTRSKVQGRSLRLYRSGDK